ncbi:hypothetical protein N0V82_009294 [Gnomoniopsis sp. IMI 355080]|nr:hypothetical protein N0V82_009294 [Gnomoniopsis sp. IMI 355080]
MPHKREIEFIPLHPTVAAEVKGVDFSNPIPDDTFAELQAGIAKAPFAARFGPLDDCSPYTTKVNKPHRLSTPYLFDISNLQPDNTTITPPSAYAHHMAKGNLLFHVDSSFNPRRASLSLLRAARLPPPGTGGATEFADTRAAWDDLSDEMREDLQRRDYVAAHSLMHSRKLASPDFLALADVDPEAHPMARHRLAQVHEASGRWNLYIASHVHHVEGLGKEASDGLVGRLYGHATQPKYVVRVEWENEGDLVMWDNTCVMHRATEGSYEGKYVRDMRRATVHDTSSQAWGFNDQTETQQGWVWKD